MELNAITGSINPLRPKERVTTSRVADGAQDQVTFRATEQLQAALDEAPEIRADKVARAQKLVGSVPYPPMEMIQKISNLLANSWNETENKT